MIRPPVINGVVTCTSLFLACASSDAFVPSSSFVKHVSVDQATRVNALSMNLSDRFVRVAKSNLNDVLKSVESPEKIMNQAVEDMQKDLSNIRSSYAEVTAAQRRLLRQKEDAKAQAKDWYDRAQLALKRDSEQLAREALARRQQQLEVADALQEQVDAQAANLDKLYNGVQALEQKIMETKGKKEQYVARAKKARTMKEINDMNNEKLNLGDLTGASSAMAAFARMEEKVEALEAAAEASAEMSDMNSNSNALPGSKEANLEREFALLEGSATVDEELKKLKGMLSGSSSDDKDK